MYAQRYIKTCLTFWAYKNICLKYYRKKKLVTSDLVLEQCRTYRIQNCIKCTQDQLVIVTQCWFVYTSSPWSRKGQSFLGHLF